MDDKLVKMSKSKVFCCVYGCNSCAKREMVSFHFFPKHNSFKIRITNKNGIVEKVDVRKIWEKNLRCGKKITNSMRVCSKHFEESDFYPRAKNSRRQRLKKNAVPTKNLPEGSHDTTKKKERRNISKYESAQPIVSICFRLEL
ncbi:uncharacterized protein LOC123313013 [Coccinella septempunctata]|uniref:uncharacterized protein LOC123313013 n=1 Tax=Coccinella septempunctata TaxID=41139 RepID=UPI001D0822E9|nr:uncharacterized protein LOC123313013 [Coccinella septempunctata]